MSRRSPEAGSGAQGGVRVRRAYRNSRPAFAPPPPEPGAGSSRAVGRGKGPECHGTLRGPRAGEMERGRVAGDWVGATEERRTCTAAVSGAVRQAWAQDWRWKSSMGPTGGNHEPEATAWRGGWGGAPRGGVGWKPEARPQHRTQVKPCAGSPVWVSAPPSVTPDIQSTDGGVMGPGAAGHPTSLPWEVSMSSPRGKPQRHGRDLVAPPGNQAANREHKLRPTARRAILGSGRAREEATTTARSPWRSRITP